MRQRREREREREEEKDKSRDEKCWLVQRGGGRCRGKGERKGWKEGGKEKKGGCLVETEGKGEGG